MAVSMLSILRACEVIRRECKRTRNSVRDVDRYHAFNAFRQRIVPFEGLLITGKTKKKKKKEQETEKSEK